MSLRDAPIRRKLMTITLATSGLVLLLTCTAFFAYEFVTFRRATVGQVSTLGRIIATNSTAALAFENPGDARDILAALKAEPHIVAAALYDGDGHVFAIYPDQPDEPIPPTASADGYRFESSRLVGFAPVAEGNRRLGTLYLRADMGALYERLRLYAAIALLVSALSFLVAYLLSHKLQGQISGPILTLAGVAKAVSDRQDYSVRAPRAGKDEVGALTDAFNHMLAQTEQAEGRLRSQLARLDLLHRITRAIGERQDLPSVFRVVAGTLEADLPIDFACVCLYDGARGVFTVTGVGVRSAAAATSVGVAENTDIPIDQNGLALCLQGKLLYEADVAKMAFPLPQRLAQQGLRSLVAAPLVLESQVFGVLIAARKATEAFSSADCEFLRQLSEHVALAAQQTQIHTALQQAYDELRQSQQTVLQQERLRALGQMASGIAHDINNAISPVALYIEVLLEKEQGLSVKAREYLQTIERAIDDVASTVARMREFYRQREPQLSLAPADVNDLVQQVLDLTRVRWSDMPQQRGVVVEVRKELTPNLPRVMGAEGEIRDALTNLVFNAIDAMAEGGTLTLRTAVKPGSNGEGARVEVEVSDTGAGMDEETRRRCLEPFYTTKGERGTGLGLAMVYGMVQRHSAEIEIDSTVGKGTTVRLRFLAPAEVLGGNDVRVAPVEPLRQRILVVDDDPMLLKSLRDALEGDGHVITTANGGREGIDAFRIAIEQRKPFDVVITDLGMPHVDGRQVAREIKGLSLSTPIILLTGWGQRLLAEGDIPPHVDRLMSKPPKLSQLREALAQVRSVLS